MNQRKKVLVSAYGCNPYRGSEDGVGWGWVNAIARYHDVWVLTAESNRGDIENEIEKDPQRYKNMQFFYAPRSRWRTLEKIWPPAYYWTYQLWQRDVYRQGVRLHEKIAFDLIHVITYVTFRSPGYLWRLDVPFVWGPIGGLESNPWRFIPHLGVEGCLYFTGRNLITSLHKRFLTPSKKAMVKARGGIIAATEGIRREILKSYGEDSEVICEIGLPSVPTDAPSTRKHDEPLRLCWSGNHFPGKALPFLLKALAKVSSEVEWTLDILGNGPCTAKWRSLAMGLGLDGRLVWHGRVGRSHALSTMRDAHLFVITSMSDLTSTVLIEALAIGLPVVCPDHFGFSDVVTHQCGVKIPVRTPRHFVQDLTAAIDKLWQSEEERQVMAKAAMERAKEFSWENKAEKINHIYLSRLSNS